MSVDIREYTDLEIIEECFKAPHCEERHEVLTCTHVPVARIHYSCAGETHRVCQAKVDYMMFEPGTLCGDCGAKPVEECWIISPLT